MCESNLMADKEDKGGKSVFIFHEVLIFFFLREGLRYFAIHYLDKKVNFTKQSNILKKKKCSVEYLVLKEADLSQ